MMATTEAGSIVKLVGHREQGATVAPQGRGGGSADAVQPPRTPAEP